jgi:glycosyltransferase involved in cell wall biosynthesis
MASKILFLVPYPLKESPSQRFRFEQYFSKLEARGFTYEVRSFLNSQNWQLFFKPGKPILKAGLLLSGYLRRFMVLFKAVRYDFVFIHREATPLGPPVIEWIIAKVLRKKIIYDFDDAIWLTDRAHEPKLFRIAKWRSKVSRICRWAYKASCGNEYLRSYAARTNPNAVFNPTTIDTEYRHNPSLFKVKKNEHVITLGWTGSHSTLKYLHEIEGVLQRIEAEIPAVRIMVIADRQPELALRSLVYVPWNEKTEIEDLSVLDIGLMPLPDDEWAKGKCGFKILQYLALEIPAIASPVGVNANMIHEGETGYLCTVELEWYVALKKLIENKDLRKLMGTRGRQFVKAHYSVSANTSNFLGLFE